MVIQPWALHASHDVYQIPEALMPFLPVEIVLVCPGSEAARKWFSQGIARNNNDFSPSLGRVFSNLPLLIKHFSFPKLGWRRERWCREKNSEFPAIVCSHRQNIVWLFKRMKISDPNLGELQVQIVTVPDRSQLFKIQVISWFSTMGCLIPSLKRLLLTERNEIKF